MPVPGRTIAHLGFEAIGRAARWKLAIILEGVYSRYAAGGYGKAEQSFEQFAKSVEDLANPAAEAEARVG
jgi:hypothetical protein